MDQMVLAAQQWVNATYGDVPGYNKVTEDGVTGWNTMYALTRGLQHELGITALSDAFGPTTLADLQARGGITLEDSNTNLIHIVQAACYCKGYDAGAINGQFGLDTQMAVASMMDDAGLGDALARAVRTYSQGMRQRLAIAQAMLGLPDLLILDEPTNGLDPPQIREMREVMIRYAAAGRTVIVSSHLLSEVEQSCTHLVVMDRGRLVQAGPVRDIIGSGDTLLVGTAGPVEEPVMEKVAALPGVASAVRTDDGLLVRLAAGGTAERLVVELVRLSVPVASVGPHRRLEDAFLTLIGGSA